MRPATETEAEQQGPPQANPAMGRAIHRCPRAKARNLQASQREGRNPHQRLKHRTTTLFRPLISKHCIHCFSKYIKKAFFSCSNFSRNPPSPSMGDRRYDNTTRETRLCLCRTEPPSGAKRGGPLSPRHHFLIVLRKNFYAKLSRVL